MALSADSWKSVSTWVCVMTMIKVISYCSLAAQNTWLQASKIHLFSAADGSEVDWRAFNNDVTK